MSKNHASIQIVIAGHRFDDREYMLDHIRPMFEQLFAKPLKTLLFKNQNTMILYTYSKRIAEILHKWGMPIGRKKLSSLTPTTDLEEVSFVRGLFDTDGCIYRKYGPYMQIQFKLANPDLLTYVKECLERRGLHPTSIKRDDMKFRFYLSRQIEINRFFEVIEPKNIKHLKRFYDVPRQQSFRSYNHHPRTFEKSGPDQAL